jgi:predicted enzyme related to lactoylglutathione lyase
MIPRLIINIDVPDIGSGVAFYELGLGFCLRRMLFNHSVAELEGAGSRIFLIQQPANSKAVQGSIATRYYSNHWTPVHLDFAVDDFPAAVATACAAGATASVPVSHHAFGDLAPMRDPFGNGFCLIEFNESGYDPVVST